jgi:5-methylcytosine-specific restriction endonuclease McrA
MKNIKDFPDYDPTRDLSLAPKPSTKKRGMGARPLLEHEIIDAQKKARSAAEAARLLGVAYNTYKKYAKLYGVFEDLKNQAGVGIRRINPKTGELYSLDDVLEGKYPNYPLWKLKRRLLHNGYLKEECSTCGYHERRITDHKVPILLDFIDGNKKNFSYDNLRMLCYNCYFLEVGNLSGPSKSFLY